MEMQVIKTNNGLFSSKLLPLSAARTTAFWVCVAIATCYGCKSHTSHQADNAKGSDLAQGHTVREEFSPRIFIQWEANHHGGMRVVVDGARGALAASRSADFRDNAEQFLHDWETDELKFFATVRQDFDEEKDTLFYYSYFELKKEDFTQRQEQGYLVLRTNEIRMEFPIAGNIRSVDAIYGPGSPRLGATREANQGIRPALVQPAPPVGERIESDGQNLRKRSSTPEAILTSSPKAKFFRKHPNLKENYVKFWRTSPTLETRLIHKSYQRRLALVMDIKRCLEEPATARECLDKLEFVVEEEHRTKLALLRKIEADFDEANDRLVYLTSDKEMESPDILVLIRDKRIHKQYKLP